MMKIVNERGIKEVDKRQDSGDPSPIWVKPKQTGGKIKNFFKSFKSQCKNRSPWNGRNFVFYSTGRKFNSKPLDLGVFNACAEGNGCRVCVLEETVGEYRRKAEGILEEYKPGMFASGSKKKKTYRCSSHCGSGSAAGFTDAGPPDEAVADRSTIEGIEKEFTESGLEWK